MKFRPAIQFRFRSLEQFNAVKASSGAVSVNEFILQAIESRYPGLRESDEAIPVKTVAAKSKAEVAEGASCEECGSLNGLHQRGCKRGKK